MKRLLKLPDSGTCVALTGDFYVRLLTHWNGKLMLCPGVGRGCLECQVRRPVGKNYLPVWHHQFGDWRMIELTDSSIDFIASRDLLHRTRMLVFERASNRVAWEIVDRGVMKNRAGEKSDLYAKAPMMPRVSLVEVRAAVAKLFDVPNCPTGEEWNDHVRNVAKARMDAHHDWAPQLPFEVERRGFGPYDED